MEDECDVYADLEEFRLTNILNEKNNLLVNLEEQYNNANNEIGSLEKECTLLKKKCKNLEKSFWSLLETSRAEIKRKDAQLDTLKKQRDDIAFRRINTSKEFIEKYPSEKQSVFVESETKMHKKYIKETVNTNYYTNSNYNRFKYSDEERNKNMPMRKKNPFLATTQDNRDIKKHNNIQYPTEHKIDHESFGGFDKNPYPKNLSLRKIKEAQDIDKKYNEKIVEIKKNYLSKKEKRHESIPYQQHNDKLDLINKNCYERKHTMLKQNTATLSKENFDKEKSIKADSRLSQNDKKKIDKNQDSHSSSMNVVQKKDNELKVENIKSILECLDVNKKIDDANLCRLSTKNKSNISSKIERTFEEILFDDMVSGRDALKLKPSSVENTPVRNHPDSFCIYTNLEEPSPSHANAEEISKKLSIDCFENNGENKLENIHNENLDETLEEGALIIDDESDEPLKSVKEVTIKLKESNLKSNVKNNVIIKDLKNVNEYQNVFEEVKHEFIPLKKTKVNLDAISNANISKENINNTNKDTESNLNNDSFHSDSLYNGTKFILHTNDDLNVDLEPSKSSMCKKTEKGEILQDFLPENTKSKFTNNDVCQKENKEFISNSLKKYKIPKIKKSTDHINETKVSTLTNANIIGTNIISESDLNETITDKINEKQENLKLHLVTTKNPEAITSAVASITYKINNENLVGSKDLQITANSPQTSESFKSVQTSPESSQTSLHGSIAETSEATAFLTNNLLTPLKLNTYGVTEEDNKSVEKSNINDISNTDKDNQRYTERDSIDAGTAFRNMSDIKNDALLIENQFIAENKEYVKRKIKTEISNSSNKKFKSETKKFENEPYRSKKDNSIELNLENIDTYLIKDNFGTTFAENVTTINNSKKTKQNITKTNENENTKLSKEINDEYIIFATRSTKKNKKRFKTEAYNNVNIDNNDYSYESSCDSKLSLTSPKSIKNIQSNDDSCPIVETINSNIRKSTRIADKKAQLIVKIASEEDNKEENKNSIKPESEKRIKLSAKDEELYDCFFKSPLHCESLESINTSGKSESCHQLEKDFEQMFSTPSPNPISEYLKENKTVENTVVSNENNNTKSKLNLLNNKESDLNKIQHFSCNFNSTISPESCNLNTTTSPLVKKYTTALKDYELIIDENENANENITWVIKRRKIKKRKKIE